MRNQEQAIDILLVDDSPGDVRLIKETFKENKVNSTLHIVENGVEAMAYLRHEGRYHTSIRPDIILLDLNLPKKDGRQVLAEIKQDPLLKTIPVIILTTSKAEEDILKTYQLHATCYITKPVDLDQFMKVMQSIQEFWLKLAQIA